MKKYFIAFILIVFGSLGVLLSSCNEDKEIDYNKLPDATKQFIDNYFPGVTITDIKQTDENAKYHVTLANGFELKFFGNGSWQEVDAGYSRIIPQVMIDNLLPGVIYDYIETNYPQASVEEMSFENYGYHLELNTNPTTELNFNFEGGFMNSQTN